jgi:dipeptidyl aminopeptidase/acylaminoacyl peptidase
MTSERHFDQDLPDLLAQVAQAPAPDYRDLVVQQTARMRQRPAWTFPERWLPMSVVTSRAAMAPRFPLRIVGVVALLLLALIVGAVLIGGSQRRLPAPFGPARNGLVAYASGGDIFTGVAVTGNSTTIVKGPGYTNPRWSRDGTQLVFQRQDVVLGPGLLYVARADGSNLVQVTPQPLPAIENYSFSPDGKEILIAASPAGVPRILIAATDGRGIRQLDLPGRVTDAAWRPPAGSEILVMDSGDDPNGSDSSIYAVNPQDGKVRTILKGADATGLFRGHPAWSPDGSMISFGEWCGCTPNDALDVQTHIIAADGTADRILPIPTDAVWQAPYGWSNAGTRLLAIRGYTGGIEQARPVAIPVDGSGSGREVPYPGGMGTPATWAWEWAPDDSSILGTPADASGAVLDQVLLDPMAGTSRSLPWASVSQPSWQRVAP